MSGTPLTDTTTQAECISSEDCTEGRTIAALYIARDYLAAEQEAK